MRATTRRQREIDPTHRAKREQVRSLGVFLCVVGGVLTAIGLGSFFTSFGSFGPPRYFWCAFVGLPMLGFGFRMLRVGYLGTIARFVASETAPVAKDTFNYLADGTREGVAAIRKGLAGEAADGATVRCAACAAENDPDARFCKACGASLELPVCGGCGERNDADARFCDHCGAALPA